MKMGQREGVPSQGRPAAARAVREKGGFFPGAPEKEHSPSGAGLLVSRMARESMSLKPRVCDPATAAPGTLITSRFSPRPTVVPIALHP